MDKIEPITDLDVQCVKQTSLLALLGHSEGLAGKRLLEFILFYQKRYAYIDDTHFATKWINSFKYGKEEEGAGPRDLEIIQEVRRAVRK